MLILLIVGLLILYAFFVYTVGATWEKSAHQISDSNSNTLDFVSIIIPARNEAEYIENTLMSLAQQTYKGAFEILLIDDHSEDDTVQIAQSLQLSQLRVIHLKEHIPTGFKGNNYKKLALTIGHQKSKGDIIIHTDADCTFHKEWIQTVTDYYKDQKSSCIVGPIIFEKDNTLINAFQNLDIMTMMAMTHYGIYTNSFYLANGANLTIDKKEYLALNHSLQNSKYASGDDVFLVQKMAQNNPNSVDYILDQRAVVTTKAERKWATLWQQRLRWSTKNKSYDNKKIQMVMGSIFIFNNLILILGLGSLFSPKIYIPFALLLGGKLIVDYFFFKMITPFFNRTISKYIPVALLHILYITFIGWSSFFVSNYKWKDRDIH